MDDKPAGAPPETEPVKPKISNEDKPIFSWRELELIEVSFIDGYRYLTFMVRGEFIILIREFEYYSWLSLIFQEIEFIQADGGECICDICEPEFSIIEENHKILSQKIDFDSNSVVEQSDKFIKIYDCFNLNTNTIVGIHENHNDENVNKD